jgi:hypothetical protein
MTETPTDDLDVFLISLRDDVRLIKSIASNAATQEDVRRSQGPANVTTSDDLEKFAQTIHQDRSDWRKAPLWTGIISLVIVAASFAVLYGVTWWHRGELDELLSQVKTQRAELSALEAKTGGVSMIKSKNGLFVAFPKETDLDQHWTCGDLTCIKVK